MNIHSKSLPALIKKVFAFSVFLNSTAVSSVGEIASYSRVEGHYAFRPQTVNTFGLGGTYSQSLAEDFGFSVGGVLSQVPNTSHAQTLQYRAQLHYSLAEFYTASLRIQQERNFPRDMSATHLFLVGETTVFPLPYFGLGLALGWWERFSSLHNGSFLPQLLGASLHDRDFAFGLWFVLRPTPQWDARLGLATYDAFEIDNLQNPHFGLSMKHTPSGARWAVELYSRYRLLLGFGRLDDFSMGLALRFFPSP